jgi:O-antigen ligase
MDTTLQAEHPFIRIEDVVIGDRSSRFSSAIFSLIWFVPVTSTILFGGVDTISWVLISIVWLAIVLLWLAETRKGKGLLVNPSSLQIPIAGLLLIGLIQLLPIGGGADSGTLAVDASRSLTMDPYATRFFVLHLAVYLIFFAACLTFINNESRLKKTVLMVIVFGAIMAFFGIMQRLANPEGIYGLRGTPQAIPFGPFVNQHHFAAFMEMTSGVTLGLLFGKRMARDKKILLAFAVVVMGVAIVFTSSRGGLLGFISVLAFVGILNFFSGRWSGEKHSKEGADPQRKMVLAAATGSLILLIFGVVLFLGGNESLFRGIGVTQIQDGITNGRAHFWPIALKIFLEHPILGAGLDAFGVAFTKHDTWSGLFRVEQAHNDYLQTLADAGIVGFICVAAFIYLLFKKGLRTIATGRSFRREAAIGALAGCFGILIHSFFDFPLRTPSNAFFFLMLCAIATVPVRSAHSEHSKKSRRSSAP